MSTYENVPFEDFGSADSNMLALFAIFGQHSMDPLISLTTDEATKAAYVRMHATLLHLQAQRSLSCHPTPAETAIREALGVKRAELENGGLNAAFTSAVELVYEVWPQHIKYGSETAMPLGSRKKPLGKCKKLLPYTKRLRNYVLDAREDAKGECGTYTLSVFWSKVAWYHQELSKYTEALAFASLGLSICDKALDTVFADTCP
ncbi:hypothetical protein ABVK25_011063 [Lepraria finkii]|uniref:Uncharacterized protein n=1 Tax=Lepraria finkii TaxID=1340010 RepID=A0ABR4ASF7_9LECA